MGGEVVKVVVENIHVSLRAVLEIERDTTGHKDIVHHLMGQKTGTLRVTLSQLIQLHYNTVRRIDLKSIIFAHLVHLPRILLLHHGHDHSHRRGVLAYEYSWLILKSLGDRNFADMLLHLIFEPKTETSHVFLR